MGHRVKLLLTDLAGELLLGIAMDDLVVLVQRPQLLEGFATGHTLEETRKRAWNDYWNLLGDEILNRL